MIKDTFFSWSRAKHLIKKNIRENWKSYGLRVLVMYSAMAIAMIWNGILIYKNTYISSSTIEPSASFMSGLFIWLLFIFGTLGASFIMEELKTKTGKISLLMTPATSFEKWFIKWFIYTILFLIVFTTLFIWSDSTKVLICKIIFPANHNIAMFNFNNIVDIDSDNLRTFFNTWYELGMIISGYLFTQSLFILGGTIWPKGAFIKTSAAITAIISIALVVIYYTFKDSTSINEINADENIMSLFFIIIMSALAIFNWVISYFRFKETEIINRM